jgi:hypothetical protein
MPTRRRAGSRCRGLALLLLVAAGSACGGPRVQPHEALRVTAPPPGRGVVYVLYPQDDASRKAPFPAPVFLEEDRGDRYLASLTPGTHLAVVLVPGEYVFTVVGQIPDMLRARVQAGRTYHAAIHTSSDLAGNPFGGGPYGRFAIEPINDPADPRLAGWLATSSEVEPSEHAERESRIQGRRLEQLKPIYRPKWEAQEAPAMLHVPTPHTPPTR